MNSSNHEQRTIRSSLKLVHFSKRASLVSEQPNLMKEYEKWQKGHAISNGRCFL